MSYLFNVYAGVYDYFMRLFHLDDTTIIEKQLINHRYQILDIGGGSGTLANYLQINGHQVTILDSSLPMLKQAQKKNPFIRIVHASLKEDLLINKVDVIICRDCFHHLSNQKKCLSLMLNYLKEDGFILIHDFNQESLRIKLLFLFERCCFEKIKPIGPSEIDELASLSNLDIEFLYQGKWDYVCRLKRKK